MKTPKEKAQDLYDTFYELSEMEGMLDWGNVFVKGNKDKAKGAAIVVCDEVVETWKKYCEGYHAPILVYWKEVKEHIGKL